MAVSCMEAGLLPITQTAVRFHNHIAYHDYEGPAIDLDEQSASSKTWGRITRWSFGTTVC